MPISTASAKAKGRKLQQDLRDKLLERFEALDFTDLRSCPMGSTGEDIQMSAAAREAIPYSFECKARANIGLIYDALEQAKRGDDRQPVAVVKADRKRPLAVVDLDHFLDLLEIVALLRADLQA